MNTKDYEKIAKIFKKMSIIEMRSGPGRMTFPYCHATSLIDTFCDMMEEDNSKFNKKRFLDKADCIPWDSVEMDIPIGGNYQ